MVLWPNGVRALRALGLGAGLDAIATPLADGGVRRPDGHWLVQPRPAAGRPDAGGGAPRRPARRADRRPGRRVELRTGVTCARSASAGERPAVSDGRHTFEADLVVAADGTDSVIRRQLAPESGVVSSGCAAWRAVIPWYRAPKLPADQPLGRRDARRRLPLRVRVAG